MSAIIFVIVQAEIDKKYKRYRARYTTSLIGHREEQFLYNLV